MDKKNKTPNVPNLRFNGYTENWQKYRTIELGQMQRGKSKHRPRDDEKLYGGAYPFIQTGDIKKANLYIKEYERTYSNYGLSQSKLWSKGTLCITIAANIAETAILGLNACFPDSVIGWISNEKITNNIFIKYYFDFYKTQLKRLSVGGAQENLNLDKLENVYFHIPTLPEQNDITNLLTKIDELIETQIKIINDYKILKNHIIKSFIKQNGTSYLLSEIAELGRGRVINSAEISKQKNPIYPVYSSQTSNNGIMGYLDNYDYEGEYITWTTDGANAGTVYYRNGKFNCTNVCGILKIKNGYDAYYISNILNCYTKKYVSTNLANPKLMNNVMANIKINLPSIEQQKHSSKILQSIEYRVEIEEDIKLNLVKQKAFLLKNMFI